jgi:hypothetical protein
MNGLQDSQRIAFWDIVRSSTVMVSTVLLFAWNASDLALYGFHLIQVRPLVKC